MLLKLKQYNKHTQILELDMSYISNESQSYT